MPSNAPSLKRIASNEMVWAMDVQIAKLNEGSKQVARRRRHRRPHGEACARKPPRSCRRRPRHVKSSAASLRRLDKESRGLSEYLKTTVERLSVDRKEFDQFDHRLRSLSGAVAESEARMDGVLQKDKSLSAMNQRADELSKAFQTLMAQADEMSRKQGALESLGDRLAQVDEMGRRTQAQHEALKQSRQDLEQLRHRDRRVPQVARGSRAVARQALGGSLGARGVWRTRHNAAEPHARARIEDGTRC